MKEWTPDEIKELRVKLKLSQQAFSDLVGVTRRYVIFLEKGVKRPGKTLKILLSRIEQNSKDKGE